MYSTIPSILSLHTEINEFPSIDSNLFFFSVMEEAPAGPILPPAASQTLWDLCCSFVEDGWVLAEETKLTTPVGPSLVFVFPLYCVC